MTFDGVKDMRIGSKKVMSAWLDGRQVYPSEKRIMDSLVCWYDIGKQQCTNESMASNPTLRDLSGNGHDATCYNFAWSGMSGIGGYAVDFTDGTPTYVTIIEHTYKIIRCTTHGTNCWLWSYNSNINSMAPFSVKISGLNGKNVSYYYSDGTIRKSVGIPSDGVYNLPGSALTENEEFQCGFHMSTYEQSLNVTIEQLPKYPNALVSDGVDDYARVTGLPILTKEKGYTIISKRNLLNYNDGKNGMLVSKQYGDIVLNICVEQFTSSSITNNIAYCRSFGKYLSFPLESIDKSFLVQTSEKYNGMQYNGEATTSDTPYLFLFSSGTGWNLKSVLYSFLLFDRDLTEQEIEWVKKNMVEGDLVLPSYELDPSLIDAWIFSGLRNEDAPASIVGEKGIELSCSNFAWNEYGSGFKDGALYFDGVDDNCVAYNKLTCDRNVTVIGKRKLTTDEYNQWQNSLNIQINKDNIPIIFLDYYESGFESAYGYKMMVRFGDYDLYYNNDTDPHTFWATKDLFNGEKYVNKATNLENGKKYNYNIYLGRVWSGSVSACAWYYLAVYDKVMTEQEAQFEIEKLEKIWSNRLNNN